ncbi:MAG: hypothetical protein Ct9H300mP17_12970 [Candidatus Nitrosopelagicus sp.]|nr:MAG: hypothetical protein Ct9H300mP17_12970 [Candidatus Nitrosopelagicus sp.]
MLEFLKISVIAYAGLEVTPCENDTVPPPIATCEQEISSSNSLDHLMQLRFQLCQQQYQYLMLHENAQMIHFLREH